MKIAINGDIINTKDIYKITKIEVDRINHIYFRFFIKFFNRKSLKIEVYSNTYYNGLDYSSIKIDNKNSIDDYENGSLQKCIDSSEYKNNMNRITELRNKLIRIWSDNQYEIPQFNYEP